MAIYGSDDQGHDIYLEPGEQTTGYFRPMGGALLRPDQNAPVVTFNNSSAPAVDAEDFGWQPDAGQGESEDTGQILPGTRNGRRVAPPHVHNPELTRGPVAAPAKTAYSGRLSRSMALVLALGLAELINGEGKSPSVVLNEVRQAIPQAYSSIATPLEGPNNWGHNLIFGTPNEHPDRHPGAPLKLRGSAVVQVGPHAEGQNHHHTQASHKPSSAVKADEPRGQSSAAVGPYSRN